MSPRGRSIPTPSTGRRLAFLGWAGAPLGSAVSCLKSSYLGILTAASWPLSLILK